MGLFAFQYFLLLFISNLIIFLSEHIVFGDTGCQCFDSIIKTFVHFMVFMMNRPGIFKKNVHSEVVGCSVL